MVSVVAAVTQEGQVAERNVSSTTTKDVANLKMGTGRTNMSAAFWDYLAETMSAAKIGEVYRIDWVLLKQDAPGKYSLSSRHWTTVHRIEGDAAYAEELQQAMDDEEAKRQQQTQDDNYTTADTQSSSRKA